MFQLPIPNKRITWFFSIFFISLFLFVYYRYDSFGYGMFEKSLEQFFYTTHGSIEDKVEFDLMIPRYKNFEAFNFVYFQVKNISPEVIKKLEINVYDEDNLINSRYIENEETITKLFYSELLQSNKDGTIEKNVIYDLQPKSETLFKIQDSGQSLFSFSLDLEFFNDRLDYSSKRSSVNDRFRVNKDINNSIKMTLIPFLLLSPFSTAIFPVAILFLGYLFEAMFLDKKYEFDELRFFTRNIFHSIFYFFHKIKVKVRKIRKKTISVDEDNSKKELMNNKELEVIWRFIGMYFFSIIILYTLFSWYIVSFWYLSPLLIILSVVGILLITRILYSNYKNSNG